MLNKTTYDTIIIGGGLSGISAAIALQKSGYKTLIVEKRSKLGGLCGTFQVDGHEFIIACNDFGKSITRYFKELGIPQNFWPSRMKIYYDFGEIVLPLKGSVFKMLRFTPDLVRLIKAAKGVQKGKYNYVYLNELIKNHIKNDAFKDLMYTAVYGAGIPSKFLRITDIVDSLFNKELDYGYNETFVPVGGLDVMIKNMVEHYKKHGGNIFLNTEVNNIDRRNGEGHQTKLSNGDLLFSKTVVSSTGRLNEYPSTFKDGMKLAMLHMVVGNAVKFPKNIHSVGHFPKGIDNWINKFYDGELPDNFGFHCIKSELPNDGKSYSLTAVHFVPRGMDVISIEDRKKVRNLMIKRMNKFLPGIKDHILYEKYMDPADFSEIHEGLSSFIFSKVIVGDFVKPEIYDSKKDIYFIGNTVNPPGEHGCGAILSGIKAAELVRERLNANVLEKELIS